MENDNHDFVQFDELDKPRRIRFDTNAICDFDDAAGRSIMDVVFGDDRLTTGDIRILLWAGLKWEDRRLTKERAGTLLENFIVEGGKVQELADAITEAVSKSRLFQAITAKVADPNAKGEETTKSSPSDSGSTSNE